MEYNILKMKIFMEKIRYIVILNVLSCFAVLMLHTNSCFWVFSYERYWFTANIIESVMYFAVPIFFMNTGATLIDYRERYTTKKYFIKRIKKVVIPFFFWSLIGLLYKALIDKEFINALTFNKFIEMIINTETVTIYWFFIPLISIYLSIPVLSAIDKKKRKVIFSYLGLISFITVSFLPFLCNIFNITYNQSLIISVGSGYIMYVIFGYLISHYDIPKKLRCLIYLLSISALLLHIFGTYFLSITNGYIVQTFKGYLNTPCVLYSIGVFVYFKYNKFLCNNIIVNKLFDFINQYTFSTYLIHYFVINILTIILTINIFSIKYRLVFPFIYMAICILITNILRKIPYLKNIVP